MWRPHQRHRCRAQDTDSGGGLTVTHVEACVAKEISRRADESSGRMCRAADRPWARDRDLLVLEEVSYGEAMRHNLVGEEERHRQTERLEDDLSDATGDVKASVVVRPDLAERCDLRQLPDRGDHACERVATGAEVVEVIPLPAARVRQEVAKRDPARDVLVRKP